MRKTILTIFASALLAGSMVQAATAGDRHHFRGATRAPVRVGEPFRNFNPNFRNAYGSAYPDYGYWASRLEGGAISAPAGR